MRKIIILYLILFLASLNVRAEQSALLYANGKVKVYTGIKAFENAYSDAAVGDTITLSAGKFYPPDNDMTKSVYVCGNGAYNDEANNTIFEYSMTIKADGIKIEGIAFTGTINGITVNANNVKLFRCYISKLDFNSATSMYARYGNTLINQSSVDRVEGLSYVSSIQFYNSTIGSFEYESLWGVNSNAANSRVVNCVIYSSTELPKAVYENNIIEASRSYGFYSESKFYNNVFYDDNIPTVSFPSGCTHIGDMFSTYAELFNNDPKLHYPAIVYNAPNGGDGTPVGIYGGQGLVLQPEVPSLNISSGTSFITNTNIVGRPKGIVEVNALTNAPLLRFWWNDDFVGKQDLPTNNTSNDFKLHKEALKMPSSARGKGPQKGVATLHAVALSSSGAMSGPINTDITYSIGPTLTSSSYYAKEGDVITLKWKCSTFSGSQHAVYYSLNEGPWILCETDAVYDSTTGSYSAKFKGKKGNYRFVVSVRTYINGVGYIRTPLDDEWSVLVIFTK